MNLNVKKTLSIATFASTMMTTLSAFSAMQGSTDQAGAQKVAPTYYPSSSFLTNEGLNLFVYGDVLYLTAKEEGLEFAAVMDAPSTIFLGTNGDISPVAKTSFRSVDFDWHVGFRLGAGWHMHHDFWDLSLEWMHYNHKDHKSLDPDPTTKTLFLTNILPDTTVTSPNQHFNFAETAKESWKLNFNTLDLNLSKSFWVSRRLGLTPHVGLRTAWIDQKINQRYTNISNNVNFVASGLQNKSKQDFWGIGFRGGIDTRWALTRRLSIFGNFSVSPLWSCIELKDNQTVQGAVLATQSTMADVRDSYHGIKFNSDMQLGLQWDCYFSNDGYHLGFRTAWEYHYWFNQLEVNRYGDRTLSTVYQPNAFSKAHGDLSLYGVSFGIVFDF